MRVIPLTSLLTHKERGSRSPNLDYTLSLDVKELFKHTLREDILGNTGQFRYRWNAGSRRPTRAYYHEYSEEGRGSWVHYWQLF